MLAARHLESLLHRLHSLRVRDGVRRQRLGLGSLPLLALSIESLPVHNFHRLAHIPLVGIAASNKQQHLRQRKGNF